MLDLLEPHDRAFARPSEVVVGVSTFSLGPTEFCGGGGIFGWQRAFDVNLVRDNMQEWYY